MVKKCVKFQNAHIGIVVSYICLGIFVKTISKIIKEKYKYTSFGAQLTFFLLRADLYTIYRQMNKKNLTLFLFYAAML